MLAAKPSNSSISGASRRSVLLYALDEFSQKRYVNEWQEVDNAAADEISGGAVFNLRPENRLSSLPPPRRAAEIKQRVSRLR
jgi:hypothetical protein